jgi:phosphotransferase family enzyme
VRLRFTEAAPAERESKPPWSDVPPALVAKLERVLGSPVIGADIAWGGYSPSASFHLTLADGRRAFVKGAHPGQTPEGRLALEQEIDSYRELDVLRGLAPGYLGTAACEGWSFLVLEAVAEAEKPLPWSRAKLERLAASLADFYERARPVAMTWQRPRIHRSLTIDLTDADSGWALLAQSPEARAGFLSLFHDPAAADRWLDRSLPQLLALQSAAGELLQHDPQRETSLIHLDLRSDNLLFRPNGAPVLLDWPYVTKGPVALDVVFFAPSVEGEGGPPAREIVTLFSQALGSRFPHRDQQIALAFAAGFFADKAYLASIPGLPRLRWVQRMQLAVCLGWAAGLIGLPEPPRMIGQTPRS